MSFNPQTSGLRSHPSSLPPDVVLRVSGVSKKFCRNLRRSMWYGIQDLAGNLLGIRAEGGDLKLEKRAEGGNLKLESGELISDVDNASGFKSHPSSLLTKAEGGNLKLEGRVEGGNLRAEAGAQSSGFIPHPSSLPSGFNPHPSDDGLRRDEFWALRDISFDLKRGERLGRCG